MPFYEYECKSCGHELEAMQRITDTPLKKCPQCGKSSLARLMSAPVFRLKGGGWYETDFKSDQDGKRNLADRPDPEPAKDEKPQDEKKGDKKDDKQDSKDKAEAPTAKDAKSSGKAGEAAADKSPGVKKGHKAARPAAGRAKPKKTAGSTAVRAKRRR